MIATAPPRSIFEYKCETIKLLMRCSVCDALHREHSLMCEVEATASLQQRYDTFLPSKPETPPDGERDEIVLMSRKRQARIASRLEQHKARAHCA